MHAFIYINCNIQNLKYQDGKHSKVELLLNKMSAYNLRNPAVKRLMREAEELRYPTKEYHAQPLEDNLFEWHFTISGPPNTEFEGGIYHGRITLPPDYPMKPPSIILLTPNGRFETNKKICLSISGYHPESWQPSWSIRTALLAIIGFLPTHGNGAIGSLDYTPDERKELALKSQCWKCPQCGHVKEYLAEKEERSLQESSVSPEKAETINMDDNVNTSPESKNVCNGIENFDNTKQDNEIPQTSILDISNENSILNDSMPSSSYEKESSLRQRQPISQPPENNQTTVINDASRPSSNWSLGAIWVIVILLGILIFRRIVCQ